MGGEHCRSIAKRIEAPEYQLSAMNDNPNKKSILATYKNLDKLYFRAYSIDLMPTLEKPGDDTLIPYLFRPSMKMENLISG